MVATWKTDEVTALARKITKANTVGLVEISNIPSRQFQQFRRILRGRAQIRVVRLNLIRRALAKAMIEGLSDYANGPTGLILSNLDPFRLCRLLEENKSSAPAKPGSVAPYDIVIPAGDTPFAPGPIIGELQGVGIKAAIEKGKIVVRADSKIVSAGEAMTAEVANVLSRFGIEPMEVKLHLVAAHEGGLVFANEALAVDPQATRDRLSRASQQAVNLAYAARILNGLTIKTFLQRAFAEARNLALAANIVTKETARELLAKADYQMISLASRLSPGSVDEELAARLGSAIPAPPAAQALRPLLR